MLNQGRHPQHGRAYRLDQDGDPDIFPLLRGQQWPTKTTEWSTTTLRSKSGRVFRKQNFSYPIHHFAAKYSSLSQKPTRQELSQLSLFFNARAGSFGDFFYYDPSDHHVEYVWFGTGDGTTTIFQLRRAIRYSTQAWFEPVFAVSGTPAIYIDGVGTAYTLLEHGKVQFAVAPASGAILRWTGTFLFWCHFDTDELTTEQLNSLLWSSDDGLPFSSLRP